MKMAVARRSLHAVAKTSIESLVTVGCHVPAGYTFGN